MANPTQQANPGAKPGAKPTAQADVGVQAGEVAADISYMYREGVTAEIDAVSGDKMAGTNEVSNDLLLHHTVDVMDGYPATPAIAGVLAVPNPDGVSAALGAKVGINTALNKVTAAAGGDIDQTLAKALLATDSHAHVLMNAGL